MQVKKTIKKIAALTAGISMVGATIFGAAAADLANYPAPFIADGMFDAVLVVGDDAKSEDVLGLTDVAMSLQYSMKTVISGAGTRVSAVGESVQITKASDLLNFGEELDDIDSKLDSSDLPNLLADITYTNDEAEEFDYEQTLELADGITVLPFKDNDYDDEETVTEGIKIDDGANVLNYTLEFTEDAESDVDDDQDLEDFEDTTLTILGRTYDIVEANNATNIKLELMRGAIKDTISEGETKIYTVGGEEYEVECVIVTDSGTPDKTQFKINGVTTKKLEEDQTDKVAGVQIGIRSILPNEAGDVTGDIVEFYLGAEKIVLEDTKEVEMDNEDVDNFNVYIASDDDGEKVTLESITLEWIADDELFITEDSEATMPGFSDVKISYEGASRPGEEEITLKPSDDFELTMTVPIKGGDFDFVISQNDAVAEMETMDLGTLTSTDTFDTLTLRELNAANQYVYVDDDNEYIIISNSNSEETHVITVEGFDDDDGCDFEDAVTGATWEKKGAGEDFEVGDITIDVAYCDEATETVNLTITDANFEDNRIYTEEGLIIDLSDFGTAYNTTIGANNVQVIFHNEVDDDPDPTGPQFNLTLEARRAVSEVKMNVDAVAGATSIGETYDDSEEDYYIMEDEVATIIIHDKGPDEYEATVNYPGGEVEAMVYVSAEATTFTSSESGAVATEVVKIEVGATKLASEVLASMENYNIITVGGPCVNTVAAALKGNPENCAEGYTPGKGLIELFDNGDNVAMLVAGYSAADTRRATTVVANYEDYSADFTGTALEVAESTTGGTSVGPVTE